MTAARSLALAVLFLAAPCASGFTVEVGQVVTLIDIEVTATALDRAALIRVINRDAVPAECELRIDSGPEELVRKVRIPAASSRLVTQSIRANTQRVRIEGVCH